MIDRYEVRGNSRDGCGFVLIDHEVNGFVCMHNSATVLTLETRRQADSLAKVMNQEWSQTWRQKDERRKG